MRTKHRLGLNGLDDKCPAGFTWLGFCETHARVVSTGLLGGREQENIM